MATNFYFNNVGASREQTLLEDLTIESIKMFGHDVYYLPRTLNNKDELHGDDDQSTYSKAILIDMYIRNYDGFQGQGVFMSKFMTEIRDQITFSVARRTFDIEVGQQEGFIRPREGDLIYFPVNGRLFEIQYVNNTPVFFATGQLQTWDLTCELFEYSAEQFSTGIEEIDSIQVNHSINIYDYALETTDGYAIKTGDDDILVTHKIDTIVVYPTEENDIIQAESDQYLNFDQIDPFSANGAY